MKIIQVPVENGSLYLKEINKKGELVFKSSFLPEYWQNEIFAIKNNIAYLNLYFIPMSYINQLPNYSK
jgi:hypothetical protein